MPMREDPAASEAEEGGAPEDSKWVVFDSSRVQEAVYVRDEEALYVRFVRPVPGEVEYVYQGVPPNIWRNFRRSSSPGKYINRVLNQYDYHRTR